VNADDILLLRQRQHPLVVGKIRHYAGREFNGFHDPAWICTPAKPTTSLEYLPTLPSKRA
jgi:hypothetical protein